MKRKIGELRNIPIVEGDKNLVREGTEIHINDLQSKGGSGGGGSSKVEYYKFAVDDPNGEEINVFISPVATIKVSEKDFNNIISIIPMFSLLENGLDRYKLIGFSFMPIGLKETMINSYYDYISRIFKQTSPDKTDEEIKETFDGLFIRITEEEFYNLD